LAFKIARLFDQPIEDIFTPEPDDAVPNQTTAGVARLHEAPV